MATMTPTTFNGHSLSGYNARFLRDSTVGDVFESTQVTAAVMADFPSYVYGQPNGRIIMLDLETVGANNTYAQRMQLKQWFNPRNDEVVLAATNENGDSVQLTCKPVKITNDDGSGRFYRVSLWASTPIWQRATQTDHSESVTTSPQTWTETNGGSDSVRPRLTITANAQKTAGSSPRSQRRVVIAPRTDRLSVDVLGNPWPYDITNGGFNATAKIQAGTMHPQGYDIHVLVNGVEVNRYLSNWGAGYGDTSATLLALSTSQNYYAQQFSLPGCSENETNTINEVGFYMAKTGTPTGTIAFKIRADNAGVPGSIVANGTAPASANVSTLTGALSYINGVYVSKPVLQAATKYWLEMDLSGITYSGGSLSIGQNASTAVSGIYTNQYEGQILGFAQSSNESSWTAGLPITMTNCTSSFRVYVNGNAKIWVPMALEAAVTRTLNQVCTTGTDLLFAEPDANSGLPDNTAWLVDSELIICRSKSGTQGYNLQQTGARGTTATYHSAGTTAYLVQHYVQLLFNVGSPQLGAKPLFAPRVNAPVIDGVNSTNTSIKWIGPFLAPGSPGRSGAWESGQDTTVVAYATVSLDDLAADDETGINFKDSAAAGSYIADNYVVQNFPSPIANSANAITIDETIPSSLSMEHLVTNDQGVESALAIHRSTDSGTGKQLTPVSDAYRYRLLALNDALVGCETLDAKDSTAQTLSGSPAGWWQTFVLDADTQVTAIAVRLKWTTTVEAARTMLVCISNVDASGVPIANSAAGYISYASATIDISTGFSSSVYKTILMTFATPAGLKAGTYVINISPSAATGINHTMNWSAASSAFARGQGYYQLGNVATVDSALDYWFRVYGTGTVQIDAPQNSGGTLTLDNIITVLDSAKTPTIVFESADQNIVYANPLINVAHPANYGADDNVTLAAVMKVGGVLDIDWDALTFTNDDSDLTDSACPYVLAVIDELVPFRYEPGANTLTVTEAGITGSGYTYRSRFTEALL